ncbi:MAG: thiolase domain-containing protein [Candidatus Aenigmarchaeota archaeon]|nr:thiolase domain-containing protein [Candidatus Aenigmarchaeota archaeon]
MRKVAVIGGGLSKFGEHWDKGLKELIAEAGVQAIQDAGVVGKDIQAVYGGTMSAGGFSKQEHIAALIADHMGLNPLPAVRVEAACASGGVALRQAYISVASGLHDVVIVGGVEKMTDVTIEEATTILGGASDYEWEVFHGATFPGIYAMMAKRHMYDFGTTEEQLAAAAVKNHENGSKNPYAQFKNKITIDDVMKSAPVALPLKLLDCSPITDGAAAVLLASEDFIKKNKCNPVWIAASAQASDTLSLHDRKSLTEINSTKVAARDAFTQARLTPKDINVAEVHDCFTIAEIMAIEDLGFFKKGEGGKATANGETTLNSKLPVNTSGGLKACGHPVGATGIKQVTEIMWQLRNQAGERQVKNANYGLAHNVGGSGGTCTVHIFSRDNK